MISASKILQNLPAFRVTLKNWELWDFISLLRLVSVSFVEQIRSFEKKPYLQMILFERQNLVPWRHTNILFLTVPPRWILEPTDKAFAQGSDAKVECKADGFPKPQVVWKKAVGKLIPIDS